MKNILTTTEKFLADEEGLTTVEYAIAGGLVGAGVIAAFTSLGSGVNRVIEFLSTKIGGIELS